MQPKDEPSVPPAQHSEHDGSDVARAIHDIRAPLHTIVGMAGLLKRTALDSAQQRYVQTIDAASSDLIRLIDDLLNAYKRESDHDDESFSPRELVEHVADLVAVHAQAKGLAIAAVIGSDVPARVVGDARRVFQVLLNLASNAVKYTQTGEVIIRVRRVLNPTVAGSAHLTFEVEDTGPGIPRHKREAIFRPFSRLKDGPPQAGVGLGLAICRDLVDRMGGQISVDDGARGGSVFTCSVPLDVDATHNKTVLPEEALRRLNVRVIGCTAGSDEAIRAALEPWQPHVQSVALQTTRDEVMGKTASWHLPLDTAPTDVCFVGSIDAAKAVRRAFIHVEQPLIVVLVTMAELASYADEIKKLGAIALPTPVRAAELRSAIARALHVRQTDMSTRHTLGGPRLEGVRVLVVDDVESNVLYARVCLEAAGANVTGLTSGEAAIALLTAPHDIDVVLLDLEMPHPDGFAILHAVRAAEQRRPVPIVVITAHIDKSEHDRAYEAQATSHLIKPATPLDLIVAVATFAPRQRRGEVRATQVTTLPATGAASHAERLPVAARVKEAQMALLRRDFRALLRFADTLPTDLADAGRTATIERDAHAWQAILNSLSNTSR